MRKCTLAAAPIAITLAAALAATVWPSLLFERSRYSAFDLAAFIIIAVGAVWGLRRGLPAWSYTWVMLLPGGISRLGSAYLVQQYVEQHGTARGISLTAGLISLGALLVAVLLAGLISLRGWRHGLFAILILLVIGALRFNPFTASLALPSQTATLLNLGLATASMVEAAAAIFVVTRFFDAEAGQQRRYLYLLAAIVFLVRPALSALSWIATTPGGDLSLWERGQAPIAIIAMSSVSTALTLLLVLGAARLVRSLAGRRFAQAGE